MIGTGTIDTKYRCSHCKEELKYRFHETSNLSLQGQTRTFSFEPHVCTGESDVFLCTDPAPCRHREPHTPGSIPVCNCTFRRQGSDPMTEEFLTHETRYTCTLCGEDLGDFPGDLDKTRFRIKPHVCKEEPSTDSRPDLNTETLQDLGQMLNHARAEFMISTNPLRTQSALDTIQHIQKLIEKRKQGAVQCLCCKQKIKAWYEICRPCTEKIPKKEGKYSASQTHRKKET
jgi:hypothetical protein